MMRGLFVFSGDQSTVAQWTSLEVALIWGIAITNKGSAATGAPPFISIGIYTNVRSKPALRNLKLTQRREGAKIEESHTQVPTFAPPRLCVRSGSRLRGCHGKSHSPIVRRTLFQHGTSQDSRTPPFVPPYKGGELTSLRSFCLEHDASLPQRFQNIATSKLACRARVRATRLKW